MKNYLLTGVSALLFCGFSVSCSHDLDIDTQAIEKSIKDTYEQVFKARFGTPSADQDWGFGSAASARTRAAAPAGPGAPGGPGNPNALKLKKDGKTFNAKLAEAATKTGDAFRNNQVSYANIEFLKDFQSWDQSGWDDEFIKLEGHVTFSNYSDDYLAQARNAILTQIPEGQNNLSKAVQAGYSLTTKGGPVTLTPIYHNSSSADKISYYYYPKNSKPSVADIKKMNKYTVGFMADPEKCKNENEHEIFYRNTFNLVYVDGNGNASYNFPADYEICFIITNYDKAHWSELDIFEKLEPNGKVKTKKIPNTPEFYGDGALNETIHNSGLVQWNLANTGIDNAATPHAAVFAIGEKNYVGFEDWKDYDYNDVIFEVAGTDGGTPVPPVEEWEELRVIAEDLSVSQSTDFDFNDVVFDVRRYTKTTENHQKNDVELILRAAGGTLPLYVAGYEIHETFGVDLDVMVNTKAQSKGLKGEDKEPVTIKLTANQYSGSTIGEIANSIDVYVIKNNVPCHLTAPKGEIASKIGVKCDYDWCDERQDIDDKYKLIDGTPLFKDYVQGIEPYNDNWYRYAYNSIYGFPAED